MSRYVLLALVLAGCQHAPYLPSRQVAELFPQANSPPAECPGQYHEEVWSDGNYFLYCWGRNN